MDLVIPESVFSHQLLHTDQRLIYALLIGTCTDGEADDAAVRKIAAMAAVKVKRVRSTCVRLRRMGLWRGAWPPCREKPEGANKCNPKRLTYTEKVARADEMRSKPTPTEAIMWGILQEHFPNEFSQQVVKFGYIPDFLSERKRLLIEVDGSIHFKRADYDRNRDTVFAARGFRTLRVDSSELLGSVSIGRVVDEIKRWMSLPPLEDGVNPARAKKRRKTKLSSGSPIFARS